MFYFIIVFHFYLFETELNTPFLFFSQGKKFALIEVLSLKMTAHFLSFRRAGHIETVQWTVSVRSQPEGTARLSGRGVLLIKSKIFFCIFIRYSFNQRFYKFIFIWDESFFNLIAYKITYNPPEIFMPRV